MALGCLNWMEKETDMSIWPGVHKEGFVVPTHEYKTAQDFASVVLSEDISSISPLVEVIIRLRALDEARGRVVGGQNCCIWRWYHVRPIG